MKKKIIGICICMLLIATAIPAVTSIKNNPINATVPSTPQKSITGIWTEKQKLLASDGAAGDQFGGFISLSGDTVIIGANLDVDNGADSGSAYVFTRTGTTWTPQQKLLASDGAAGDNFGISVSVDGDTALIGAWYDDDNGVDSGSVYIFTRTGTTWTQQQKLLASDGAAEDQFGWWVLLAGDTAFIGAPGDADNGVGSGSTYVFTRTGSTWTQQQKLLASDGVAGDSFGSSIAKDGDTVLIGADWDDDNGVDSGSVYVFTLVGTTWTQQQKLLASDGIGGAYFGVSVSLSGDIALIGASRDDDNGVYSGSAYVFTRTGTTWTQQTKLLASDGAAGDRFAVSVDLSGDTALIGSWMDDDSGSNSGSAYVFTRTGTNWFQQQKLHASDSAAEDMFGCNVLLSDDIAFIGAWLDDDNGVDSGSVYVFTKSENQPPAIPTITGPAKGKVKVATAYNFTTTDPNGDEVYFFIDWGDTTNSSWIGPYPSGDIITESHTWSKKGDYTIRAKAKDIFGNESGWGILKVTMPFSYNIPFMSFWERLFERFPNAFPTLQRLLGY